MAVGDPTGADLASGITNGNTLATYGDWTEREITFDSPIELTSGMKYAIVVKAPDVVGDAELYWSARTDNPYANGVLYRSNNSGSSWTILTNKDVWFKTKADGVEKEDGSFVEDVGNTSYSAYGTTWLAQIFTASSTYTISSVVLRLTQYLDWGGSVETVTVSIRATDLGLPGAPTNPSPSDSVDPNITLDETPLSWDASDPVADTYEIYFRKLGDDWDLVGVAQAGVEWTIDFGTLAYGTTYQWKIDATNVYGTTPGTVWSFTTISFGRILVSYVLIPGGSGAGPYDDPPGIEGTDWTWTGGNAMLAVRRLVVAINNKIWYEIV